MNRTLSRIALGVIAAAALFAVACGGGGGGGGSSITSADFNKDPVNFARVYYYTAFRIFTGDTTADDMMKLFEESCRNKVAAADVSKGLEKNRDEFPKLKGAKIEDIDFQGKAKVEKTSNGAKVTIPSAKDSRVKVDGKFVNAFEYFKGVGLASDGEGDETDEVELVLVNGRYFDADCSNLTDIADAGKRANATPTPARGTPTPVRTTPTATTGNRTPTPSATSRTGASSSLSNSDVEAYAKRYWLMVFGVYTGFVKADDILAFYTPDCRSQVRSADITTNLNGRLTTVYPKLKGEKLEDIDFGGKYKVTKTANGFSTELPGARDMRIKVNGEWKDMLPYMRNAGLISGSANGSETSPQGFTVVDGKLYDEDCIFLKDLASR